MAEKITIRVGGMSCVRCSSAVENALKHLEGVASAEVSYASGKAEVVYDASKITPKRMEKAIIKAGYTVVTDKVQYAKAEWKKLKICFFVSAFCALPFLFTMVLMFALPNAAITHALHRNGLWQLILSAPVQWGTAFRFYKGAIASLKNKSPSMDVLVSVGTLSAWGYSFYNYIIGKNEFYFESSAVIVTLVLLGKMLEARARNKTNEAIDKLMDLTPKKAVVFRGGNEIEVSTSEIVLNDIVFVRTGESIPVDGIVISGNAEADESMLTGESMPISKKQNDKAYGGTVCIDGYMTVKATGVGESTVIAGIIRLVEQAQSSKAHIQTVADKISAYFVPFVMGVSLVTLALSLLLGVNTSDAVSRAVAVLVIACPCSLGLATPTALMVGIGRGAGMGILIKNADALEHACKIKALIMDKTGTVTEGKPEVTFFESYGMPKEHAVFLASYTESASSHPIAKAVTQYANTKTPETEGFEAVTAMGVSAVYNGKRIKIGKPEYACESIPKEAENKAKSLAMQGNTVMFMGVDGKLAAVFSSSDKLREKSEKAVSEIKAMGIRTVLVTGDNEQTAKAVAGKIGADEYIASAMPQAKAEQVKRLKSEYGLTAVAGDGINDAPALAASDIGFAIGGGTDIAMETGDIILTSGGFDSIPAAIKLSKAVMRKVKQNLFWAFFYNVCGIPLAALGLLSPVIAGAAMAFSSVSVVTNSLLLKRTRLR